MTEITNKHLFVTMIIIGVITIGLIAGQYGMLGSTNRPYYYNNGLGASVYDSSYSSSGSSLNLNNRYSYVPDITRDYYAYDTTSSYSVPQTTTTTYTYSYPSETTSTQTSYYNNNSNLDAYGCAPGANYSVTTGQSCYGYNNYNNNGYYNNNNYNYNSGGYYSNGVYVDYRGCGTGIIYSVKTGQLCSTIPY